MQIPRLAFEVGLWTALVAVFIGAVSLIGVLLWEWRKGQIW